MPLPFTDVTIDDPDSPDHGKTFRITKWDVEKGEWWAVRVLQGILGKDIEMLEVLFGGASAEVARRGISALMQIEPERLKPLLDEMVEGIEVVMPDGKTRKRLKGDVEAIRTMLELRFAVWKLNLGF